MKDNKINATIAITTLIAAVLMCAALSFAIGKWSFGNTGYTIIVKFPNATGLTPNAEVKYAGAHAGTVKAIRLIPRDKQDIDPETSTLNCVEVVCDVDKGIQVGDDAHITIKQDGFGIAAKYLLLSPGPSRDSPAIADNQTVQGQPPFDLSDLIQPAGEALSQAKHLVDKLVPVMDRLDRMSSMLDSSLPPLIGHADKFLIDGDSVLANFNSPDGKKRLNEMLDSLRVSTENLKVVSSNAKALTATLAEKPWRVFWGGSTVPAPTEDAVLDSNKVIRLKPTIDVNSTQSGEMPPLPANAKK